MLTHLQIQNFKGWSNTGPLKLAPITVFFGTNSSGKSSIGQFLMMLKQTAESHDRSRVLHPGDDKSAVDLGTIDDLVFRHELDRKLEFSLQSREPSPVVIRDILSNSAFRSEDFAFGCRIRFENGKGPKAVCERFEYRLEKIGDSCSIVIREDEKERGKYRLETDPFNAVRKQGRAWPLPAPSRFFGFPDAVNVHYQNTADLEELSLRLQRILGNIAYLGPLREEPKRFYAWAGENPEDVGTRGERWVSAFLAASDRKISRGFKKRGVSFERLIAAWLKDLGLIRSFSIRPIAKGSREYRVKVRVSDGSPEVFIPDVGFGVSQLLPVLVQSFYAPANSTVIIEQPELHLHPAIQQNLADLFIGAIQAREDGTDRNVQFLIESHSEHFLRRLQRRIAEGHVSADEVAVYFCDHQAKSANTITPLELDEFGNIHKWPKDFFGDQMTDVAETQKAAIRKRRNRID